MSHVFNVTIPKEIPLNYTIDKDTNLTIDQMFSLSLYCHVYMTEPHKILFNGRDDVIGGFFYSPNKYCMVLTKDFQFYDGPFENIPVSQSMTDGSNSLKLIN